MKTNGTVKIRSLGGLVDAPLFYEWEQEVLGRKMKFALHPAAGRTKGFQSPLAISELSTGFDVQAVLLHPSSKRPLTTDSVTKLSAGVVKKLARAALYHLIFKKVGDYMFLDAMVGAQIQIAKIEGIQGVDMEKAEECMKELNTEFAKSAALTTDKQDGVYVPVIMPSSAHCLACEDSRVLTTTDKDHEGQPIEIACTECIPGGDDQYIPSPEEYAAAIADADKMNKNMASFGTIDVPSDWGSPTEEEWYEGLEPANKLAYLTGKREQLTTDSKELTKRATKADYDRIDDMDSEIRDIDAKIKELEAACSDNK